MHELLNLCQTLLGQGGQLVSPQYFLAIHRKKDFRSMAFPNPMMSPWSNVSLS